MPIAILLQPGFSLLLCLLLCTPFLLQPGFSLVLHILLFPLLLLPSPLSLQVDRISAFFRTSCLILLSSLLFQHFSLVYRLLFSAPIRLPCLRYFTSSTSSAFFSPPLQTVFFTTRAFHDPDGSNSEVAVN